jgi:hypothetical protein
MRREREGRSGRGAARGLGILVVLVSLPGAASCQAPARPGGLPRLLQFDPRTTVQEGEVTALDGEEVSVRYPKAFESPPRLAIVEFRQSWFKEKPYARSDFQFLRQEATGFRVVNNHPEQGRGSQATIKWRAEGTLAAVQPAEPPPGLARLAQSGKAVPPQIIQGVKSLGGAVAVDPAAPGRPVIGVDLHHTRITDADLEPLQGLTALRTLNVCGTHISDAGLKAVSRLTTLQALLVNETAVSDEGLRHLQALTELRELSLYHTHVTDEGLGYLKGLTNLRDLTLSGPKITDRGLAQLGGLRNLKHLYLSQTGVTPAGVQELKRVLPKAEVIQ